MKKILQQITPHKNVDLVKKLTKAPLKEPRSVAPRTYGPKENISAQLDTLYLPSDNGYKYLLVAVDIATRKTDAEPMKTRTAEATKNALLKIYKRNILKLPKYLEVDDGSEFKQNFKTYFEKLLTIKTKLSGRSRQQSVVESKNGLIGKILNEKMLLDEIATGKMSRKWVKVLPKVIQLINENFQKKIKVVHASDSERIDKYSGEAYNIGDKVRVQLDKATDYLTSKKLHGNFRSGDIKFSRKIYVITDYYLRPDQPLMYQLDNSKKVAYTKYQLQLVD